LDQTASSESEQVQAAETCKACKKQPRAINPRGLCERCFTLFKNPLHFADQLRTEITKITKAYIERGDVAYFMAMGLLEEIAMDINRARSAARAKKNEKSRESNRRACQERRKKGLPEVKY
jgi:hypothetical protein